MLQIRHLIICLALASPLPSFADEPVQPLPEHVQLNIEKVNLGERLFHDPRLSKDNSISCASCHDLKTGGTDKTPVSTGISGQKGEIRAPTVFNAVFNFRQFWNGRAATLQEQAKGPVANPVEMGADWDTVVEKLKNDPSYEKAFIKIYNRPINQEDIVDAIAEYEHSLITPSRFDDYLRGKKNAITAQEKHGYELFKSYGCVACHKGINVGGAGFEKMGLAKDYFADRNKPIKPADLGRYQVTKQEKDKFYFKVPTLRNVAIVGPYYHDGSVATLDEAIYKMGKYQLGVEIPEKDRQDIAAFLKSLTGKSLESQMNNTKTK